MTYDEPQFRQVSLDAYPDLDFEYYRLNSETLEKQGFSHLGEIEDVAWARKNKSLQTCIRVLTGDEGTTQALIYHVEPRGFLKIAKFMPSQLFKGIDLETEFSDGFFLQTTNSMTPTRKPDIEVRVEPEASLEELLDIHRERVRKYLERNPSIRAWKVNSIGGVIESRVRQKRLPKRGRSTRKTSTGSTTGFIQGLCSHKRVIMKIVAILLIGWLLGVVTGSLDKPAEQGKRLSIEEYEANYEQHKAEMMHKTPAWFVFAAVFLLNSVIVAGYELTRIGGEKFMARTLCKDCPEEPDRAILPDLTEAARKTVYRNRLIGKALVFLLVTGLLFYLTEKSGSGKIERGRQLTFEQYMADYEQLKEKTTSRPRSSTTSNPMGSIFVFAIFIGLYELVGKTAMAGTQLVISKKIPLESHIPLHISWLIICFFGGGLMWAWFVLPKLKGADTLVMLGAFFIGPALIVFLITRLFKAIPVNCPKCNGQAYWTENKPVSYTCRECNHIHRAGFSYGSAR
jgi:hypothetical protein